jgi:hypothetical protein
MALIRRSTLAGLAGELGRFSLGHTGALPDRIKVAPKSKKLISYYSTDETHILAYDPSLLKSNTYLQLCLQLRHISLLADRRSWFINLARTCLALAIALALTYVDGAYLFVKRARPVFQNANVEFRAQASGTNDRGLGWHLMHPFLLPVGTVTAFVLGGFVLQALGAWRERRTNYASLCGTSRNLLVQLAAAIPREEVQVRAKLGRWVSLALELAVLKARGAMDSEAGRSHLTTNNLLTDDEWEAMVPGDRHTTVLCWILTTAHELQREGLLSDVGTRSISEAVGAMRGQANDLMSSLNRDLPFPYAFVVSFMLQLVILIQALFTALACADVSSSHSLQFGNHGEPVWYMWVFQLGCFFCLAMLYEAMGNVHHVLYNPFGPRALDVAHETIANGIRDLGTQLMAGKSCPPVSRLESQPGARTCTAGV